LRFFNGEEIRGQTRKAIVQRRGSSTAEGLFFDGLMFGGLEIVLNILCLGFLLVKFGKEKENKILIRKER
jgi:hypothetical protein